LPHNQKGEHKADMRPATCLKIDPASGARPFKSRELTTEAEAKRDVVYRYLLTECLQLHSQQERELHQRWGLTPTDLKRLMIVSIPSKIVKIIIESEIAKTFDYELGGIPGFYYDPLTPPEDFQLEHPTNPLLSASPLWFKLPRFGQWRLNIHQTSGILRPYFSRYGSVIGLLVHKHTHDRQPLLFTSRGLLLGTPASPCDPLISADMGAGL
jgi:hypothetical protein